MLRSAGGEVSSDGSLVKISVERLSALHLIGYAGYLTWCSSYWINGKNIPIDVGPVFEVGPVRLRPDGRLHDLGPR